MSTSLPIKKGCKDAAVNNNAVVHQLLLDGVQIALVLVEGLKVGEHIILWVWPVPRRVAPVPLAGVVSWRDVRGCIHACVHACIDAYTYTHGNTGTWIQGQIDGWMKG
jgi:hypothetical protein